MEEYNQANPNNKIDVLDEDGFLNRDYVMISKDIAEKFGVSIGDRVMISITPTAGSMEVKGCIVGGILPIIGNSMVSYNSLIMNSEYVQGIGRDFDIDEMNFAVYDEKTMRGMKAEWNRFVEILMNTEKTYIEEAYKVFRKIRDRNE